MWRSFAWRDHLLALQAGFLTPLVALLLRVTSVQCCRRVLQTVARGRGASTLQSGQVHHLAVVISFGCRRYTPFPPACLVRSLVLQYLLARRGIDASLHLGSRFEEGEFCAHAWVEYQGLPLAEAQAPRDLYASFEQ